MIGQMRFLLSGFAVDEQALAVDAVRRVGIGGNYLADDHTLEHYRDAVWYPKLIDHGNHSMWQAAGGRDLGVRVREKAAGLLRKHVPEPMPDVVSIEMERMKQDHN
jgi:trimethylamine--corrinoid protein Co-methyltransferase